LYKRLRLLLLLLLLLLLPLLLQLLLLLELLVSDSSPESLAKLVISSSAISWAAGSVTILRSASAMLQACKTRKRPRARPEVGRK
jgi:hypothetical protein